MERRCEWCTFVTVHRSGLSTHRKRCTARPAPVDPEKEQLRQQVDTLTQRVRYLEDLVLNLAKGAGGHMTELHREVKEVRKRKDRYAGLAAARVHLTEPQRRAIATRQGWQCKICHSDLAEFDIDHVEPLWRGGADEDANRQAVCVACHRQKTDRERIERSTGEASPELPAGPGVVG